MARLIDAEDVRAWKEKMKSFFEIPTDNIIKESITENPDYCYKKYIVYISSDDSQHKIHVNTDFLIQGIKARLCIHYDRRLCDTLEEYNSMSTEHIERQVYDSWMDGAR